MATEQQIKIRRANEQDLPAVLAIEQVSFNTAWTHDFFKHELYNPISNFYVVEKDHQILGYVIFWLIADEMHIANLAIHPQFRQVGLGSKLLNFVLDMGRQKQIKTVTLEVNEKNLPARGLYEKMQFRVVGRRVKYYENRDDALLLMRYL